MNQILTSYMFVVNATSNEYPTSMTYTRISKVGFCRTHKIQETDLNSKRSRFPEILVEGQPAEVTGEVSTAGGELW